MAKCRWHAEPMQIVQMGEGPLRGPDPRNQAALSTPYKPKPGENAGLRYEACEVWETAKRDETPSVWVFFRVGPFASRGGYTWSRLLALYPTNGTIGRVTGTSHGGKVYIADHVAGNVDATGDLFPYPPIHQHHYHLVFGTNMWRQALNAHGDGECLDGQRHYCMLKEYPPGVAFHTTHRFGIWTDYNDVRPTNSPPLETYFFMGVKLLLPAPPPPPPPPPSSHSKSTLRPSSSSPPSPPPRPIRHSYMLFFPFLGLLRGKDALGLPTGADGVFTTFVVNPGVETVMWMTGVLPNFDGELPCSSGALVA